MISKHQLTYSQTNCDSAHKKQLLVWGKSQDDATDAEDETGQKDADPAPQPPVQGASTQGRERRSPNGAGNQQLLPQRAQIHLLLQEQHSPGDHPSVVPKEKPSQGREKRQHIDEPWRGGILVQEVPTGWRPNETPLSIVHCLLSPAAHKVAHVLQAVFIVAAGHKGNQELNPLWVNSSV